MNGADPDVVSPCEGRLIGQGPLRKALWLAGLSVSQALRPLKVPGPAGLDRWMWGNIAVQVGGITCSGGLAGGGVTVCLPLDLFCFRLASVARPLAARALMISWAFHKRPIRIMVRLNCDAGI